MNDAIAVFTDVPAEQIIAAQGSGDWILNPERANQFTYLVCCRKSRWNNKGEGIPNSTAFLVGRIKGLVQGAQNERRQWRYFIEISEFVHIRKEGAWREWRNPVRYTSLSDLRISLSGLKFQAVDKAPQPKTAPRSAPPVNPPLTIAQAKKALAETLGVRPEDIEITIRA